MTDLISAIWTDFGGVLTPPTSVTVAEFCAEAGLPVAAFHEAMSMVAAGLGVRDAMAPLDTPLVDQRSWERLVEAAATALGWTVDLSDFPRRWFNDRPANQHWLNVLDDCRDQDIFVGLLSNMPPAWDYHWRQMVDPQRHFDDIVLSAEVGVRKPEPAIFALAAQRCGRVPSECVLIDDLEANCIAAVDAGWRAIQFETAEQAQTALCELLSAESVR